MIIRLEKGFRWFGGNVGGNPLYQRSPSVHQGLVSDDVPILKLFVTKVPRATNLLTGHTKQLVDGTDSKVLALDCAYVVVNGCMRGVLRVEVDAILASWQAIPKACQAAGMAPPNVAVGYVDALGRVHNPHLLWIIQRSVAFIGSTRTPQQRLFNGVLRGLTAALIPLGADAGGLSNPLRMKNPVCPLWDRQIFADNPYTLTDLCANLDLSVISTKLQADFRVGRQSVPDHPDVGIAAQSNKLFRELAAWARQNVDRFRGAGIPFQTFQDTVEDEAFRICRKLGSTSHRTERHVHHTAQSVARWTWQNYHCRKLASRPAVTADVLRVRQATAGSATAAKRRASTEAAILEAASLLAKHSATVPTQSALIAATGKSERTIRRYWPQVVAHVTAVTAKARSEATPATRWSLVKKLTSFVDPHQPGTANPTIPTDPLDVPTDPREAAKTIPLDRPATGAAPSIPRPRPLPPVDPGFDRNCSGARGQPAGQLSRIPPAPPVNQAVRQTGMPGLQPDQPSSPGPAILGALNRAPPSAASSCTTGYASPSATDRPHNFLTAGVCALGWSKTILYSPPVFDGVVRAGAPGSGVFLPELPSLSCHCPYPRAAFTAHEQGVPA